ncbi:MAG: hypothetical protein J5623_06295 [Clostridiales bacterium]|nr:hypothetical protein [Clostridiales bacterium]
MKKYLRSHIFEFLSLFLYVFLRIINAIFHEPWYDEAIAWQIAKVADWKTIIFIEPKYEGHPPLWHIVLALFAKNGAPYELSLTIISLIFTTATVALILFKSPFPRIVRLFLPFTYFLFYQYGAVSRPYCMMMLAFVLCAMSWKERREKPFRLSLSLLFLCLTSLYGIAFAGGIAVAWAIEYIIESKNLKAFFTEKRFFAMLALLISALAILFNMIPGKDSTPVNGLNLKVYLTSNPLRFVYLLFAIPADATFTDVLSIDTGTFIRNAEFHIAELIAACIVGLLIIVCMNVYGYKKKTILLFVLPQLFFIIIASFYMSQHHIGIEFLFMLFWIWASKNEADIRRITNLKSLDLSENKLIKSLGFDRPQKLFFIQIPSLATYNVNLYKIVSGLLVCITMIVSFIWGIGSFTADIKYNFACGRYMADFIKEHNLSDYKLLSHWQIVRNEDGTIKKQNTWEYLYANNLLPYFDKNIFYNYWNGDDDRAYELRLSPTQEDNEANLNTWKKRGYPDVILNNADLALIFPEAEERPMYTTIYMEDDYVIWKGKMNGLFAWLSVRNDILEKLGFDKNAPISTHVYEYEYGRRKELPGDNVTRTVIEAQKEQTK